MTQRNKRFVLAFVWILSAALANFIGGVVGFNQGVVTEIALSADEALHTVIILRLLRADKNDEAIDTLEMHLDGQIASSVFSHHAYGSPYNLPLRFVFGSTPLEGNAWSLSKVLEYRSVFPPAIGDPSIRKEMMGALEKYRNAPRPDLSTETRGTTNPEGT